MKKVLFTLAAILGLSLALVATSCGGGGGGSDDDDETPVAGSGSTSTSVPEDFVLIPGATFDGTTAITGSQVFIAGRTVTIPSLWACEHEVTQAEYQSVMGNNPSGFSSSPEVGEIQEKRPVEHVNWYDAIAYCNKRSLMEGRTNCYALDGNTDSSTWNTINGIDDDDDGYIDELEEVGNITCNFSANGYRLPTDAEWEYLARGGNLTNSEQTKYSGSNTLNNVAWWHNNSGIKTHEVMKKIANVLGLYDMSGNVFEWCWDLYNDTTSVYGAILGSFRVSRGGDYQDLNGFLFCEVSYRHTFTPNSRFACCGFRVVCSRSE